MPRLYDAAVAALTIGAPFKWIDNLLSRHRIAGVQQDAQGITRKLSPDAILRIQIVRILTEELGLSVSGAVALADRLCATGDATVELGGGAGRIALDLAAIERRIASRLLDAVESAPRRTRGRPPGKRTPSED